MGAIGFTGPSCGLQLWFDYSSSGFVGNSRECRLCLVWATDSVRLGTVSLQWPVTVSEGCQSEGLPKLLMLGTEDAFCSVPAFQSFVDTLPEPKQAVVKDGVDHFSLYVHMRQALTDWIMSYLADGSADLQAFARSGASKAANCTAKEAP